MKTLSSLFFTGLLFLSLHAPSQPTAEPARDPVINTGNWLEPHNISWAFRNMENLSTTSVISRQGNPATPLPHEKLDFTNFRFQAMMTGQDTNSMSLEEYLEQTHTDAFLVAHAGRLVFEGYYRGMAPYHRHMLMSASKSFVGTLTAMLIQEGRVNPLEPLAGYIPKLEGTPLGQTPVQNLLIMRSGLAFSEVYADPDSEIWKYGRANKLMERPPDYQGPFSVREFLRDMQRKEPPGQNFQYITPVTDALAWLITEVTGKTLSENLSDHFWSKLGMETDALLLTDPANVGIGGSGLLATPRDLVRFGMMLSQQGYYGGHQIVPQEVIQEILRGSARFDDERFVSTRGFSYKNQWWVTHNPNDAFYAVGIYGQYIYIDPTAGLVIVKLSSAPVASPPFESINRFAFFDAITKFVMEP